MPDYQHIAFEVDAHVATITLDRPDQLNAFTARMMHELIDAFDHADADDEVRAVIVTGRGRAFCAGADLSGGPETFEGAHGGPVEDGDGVVRDGGGRVSLRIFSCNKPVIAAINGHAVGVGITMTLPMDVRFLAEGAKVGFVFSRRGITPEAASSWFLPRVVGISRAMEWVATGRVFDAAEALEAGLVKAVLAPADVLPAARALASEIVENAAPVSVALGRQMLWRMLGADHPMEAHRVESLAIASRGSSADAHEGVSAFLEKRPADFPLRVSDSMPDFYPWWDEPDF